MNRNKPSKSLSAAPSGTPRVLVVDDDPELLGFLVEFLTFKGYECDSARDGLDALTKLESAPFNLLITDISMPAMDGIELIRQSNAVWPNLPKIIISGEGQFRDAVAAIGESVFFYFTKPLKDFDKFERVIRRALAQERLARERSELEQKLVEAEDKLSSLVQTRRGDSERLEKHYRTLLENGGDAILLLDPAGKITDVNQNACRLLGFTRRELMGTAPSDELPTAEQRLFFHQLRDASHQGAEVHFETDFARTDGSRRQIDVFAVSVMGGSSPELVIYLRDVTDYHRRLQILKTRNDQLLSALSDRGEPNQVNTSALNNFMDTANAFVFIIDSECRILEWNTAAERITGILRREALGTFALQRVFSKFENQMKSLLENDVIANGKEVERIEADIVGTSRSPSVLSWNVSPIREIGKIVGALGVGIDVTSEHQLRTELETYASQLEVLVSERTRELLQSQERFRNLFEGVRDPIFAAGPEGQLLEVNPAWLRLLGYSLRSEVVGKHFLTDFVLDSAEGEAALKTLTRKGFLQDHLFQLRKKDGSSVTVLFSVTSQPAIGHESTAFEGVIRDITQLRELERQLIEHSQNLEELVRERSSELAESEGKFRRLTENSPDVIYRIDIREMRYDYLSPAAEQITGLPIPKLLSMGPDGFVSRIHPKEAPQILDLWASLGAQSDGPRGEFRFEYRFIRPDGEIVWLSDRGVVVRGPKGELLAVEGVMHDITPQKIAAAQLAEHASVLEQEVARRTTALAESEYRYRMFLSEAGDIIFTCDLEGKLIEMNRRGEDLLGRSIHDINQSGFGSLVDEASRRRFNKALMSCFKAGIKPEPFQIEYTNPRGSKLLLEIQSSPLIIDDRVILVLQVARDLTSRRRAAQAIRTLKEFNEGIIRSMSEGIFIENDEGICEFVNPAMAEMLGYQPSEMVGRHYFEFAAPVDREYIINQTQISRLRGFARYEARLTAITGEEVPVYISSRARYDGDMSIGSLSVITDLRQAKEMERRQRFMERLLADERKLADIGMLASGIAHNISSPLMVISGYAQLLRAKYADAKEFDVILGQIDKITEITRNMMSKSRSEQDKAVKPIDLNQVLQTELKFLEANLYYKSKVDKELHLDSNMPKINGVYSDFSQAFSNIINNAIDAMHNRNAPKLSVRSKRLPAEMAIEITDTGAGISQEHISRIFDPFFTTKPAIADVKEGEPSGTGLGLSTSQQLIANYGGRIEVESEPGVGSTFRIRIPIPGLGQPTTGSFLPAASYPASQSEPAEVRREEDDE